MPICDLANSRLSFPRALASAEATAVNEFFGGYCVNRESSLTITRLWDLIEPAQSRLASLQNRMISLIGLRLTASDHHGLGVRE